ncbi:MULTISPECIES: hypothetical protein [Mesorhizobium]|nr:MULTISPECIES: hypothetical protein [Mesorhizobium]ESY68960.1 hypothetical protein X742_09890 [Mesorhizobium sp. LNHC232B00]
MITEDGVNGSSPAWQIAEPGGWMIKGHAAMGEEESQTPRMA